MEIPQVSTQLSTESKGLSKSGPPPKPQAPGEIESEEESSNISEEEGSGPLPRDQSKAYEKSIASQSGSSGGEIPKSVPPPKPQAPGEIESEEESSNISEEEGSGPLPRDQSKAYEKSIASQSGASGGASPISTTTPSTKPKETR